MSFVGAGTALASRMPLVCIRFQVVHKTMQCISMIAKRIDTIVPCSACEKLVEILMCAVAAHVSNCEELNKLCFVSIIWYFACNVVVIWLSLLMKTSRYCLIVSCQWVCFVSFIICIGVFLRKCINIVTNGLESFYELNIRIFALFLLISSRRQMPSSKVFTLETTRATKSFILFESCE